ncbi:SDR family oxidoreductase [Aeromicrobium sp. Root472D3]|uniref:SDR family oxidoreductase n=1 Tax=Aeromicrobium sp. Root472D3 TaxID=1736540 RepID=UPI0006FD7A77|nr:SDR family oxidoreductase [Aeromicrobium sp. Root472D3]KQX74737.1 NAD(P)-dependent oxidoreductase [Aeromicrobium sp. Root472D3]
MPDSPAQDLPGHEDELRPLADHGETSYLGTGRMLGKVAIVTGGDSGIGKAVAIAYAREGADVVIAHLDEDDDADDTRQWIERAGRTAVVVKGDLADPAHCRDIVARTVAAFGRVDVLVNNAAVQMFRETFEEIPDEEWDRVIATNLSAMFHLVKASLPHMPSGSSIIGTSSINSDMPVPQLIPYDVTKAGIANMTAGLAQLLADRGIRANSVAPGPIWTPLIPATMPQDAVEDFGGQVPMGRPGQPAELAPVYVMLASDESSYVSGARIAVTGGKPIL